MITKSIKQDIAEFFFINPTAKLRVRELERTLNLPLPSVIRYCKELEKEGILSVIQMGSVVLYTSNRTSDKYTLEKRFLNIRMMYESGLIDYLVNELSNPPIILFGSYARGEDIEESDIDIYIQTPSKSKLNFERFEKILKRKIQLFAYKNLNDISNKNLANNIINGILLNGFVEVFK